MPAKSTVRGLKGLTKPGAKAAPKPKTGITFDSPNVIDLSKPTLPKIPPKPNQPQLPIDDAFRNIRTSTT